MRAGPMKSRLEMLRPQTTSNAYGEETITYESAGIIRAQRIKQSGHRSIEAGELFPDYRAEFNVRDAHPVKENWRVRQLGGYLYTVTNIIPNIDQGMVTLICERVNE